ncbi:peptidase M61 [Marinoscillum sp. MHG1-6]|uniref:M61 family metallopeptidase n=1 Tax=Marinoscillum sp. MHG1-6 TaxID=2959627 RepID=UPI0021571B7D|nr:peptidase M61 [Marinoscillum sp. MHG1-6]
MMIKNSLGLMLLLCTFMGIAQTTDSYKVEIDLTAAKDDKVPVTIYPPQSDSEFIEYHMSKVVPGTYSISDFGRFVTDLTATDANGNSLSVEQVSTNRWKIENSGKLTKISYLVNDSRDECEGYTSDGENVVFDPGGTDINEEKQLFVMNTFGFIGYVDGMKMNPYEVAITHRPEIYGASALKKSTNSDTVDTFTAADFNFLADGPILYCMPDTVSRQISNANISVSVFSPNGILTAKDVMDNIYDLMVAQTDYLGGELPVDRYSYLIILFDDMTLTGSYGALEHSYSSLYFLPERAGDRISGIVRDVASHEFFHIVTPLNIHAEQIGNFNYIEPEMSEHLWLYEGVTEYSSMHVQVKYGLNSPEKFIAEIAEKMEGADRYPADVSFTEMSRRILEPEFEPMYGNVYQKGALIGMCLDLYILKYSNGEKDLQWLMRQLAKKYGKEVSFKDEELFADITDLTYPEVGEFLKTYVAGKEPLPFEEVLSWAGIEYTAPTQTKVITAGNIALGLNGDNQIIITSTDQMNEFGEAMGYKEGDILMSIKGMEVTLQNAGEVFGNYKENTFAGDKVIAVVGRENKKGKVKKKKLKAKAMAVDAMSGYEVSFMEDPSEDQQALLDAWITAD